MSPTFRSLLSRPRIITAVTAVILGAGASLFIASSASAAGLPTTVLANSALGASESFKSASAVCPEGMVLLGGGADINGGGHEVHLTSLVPSALGLPTHSYYATASEDGSYAGNWNLTVWAICGTGITGWQVVSATTAAIAGSTITSATATCPGNKRVIGTGAASTGGFPYMLDTIQPNVALTNVYVEVTGDETTPIAGSAWGAKAFAICINPVLGQQLVSSTTAFDSVDKTVAVRCPVGTFLQTSAASLTGALGESYLDRVAPNNSTQSGAEAREDQTGNASNWNLTAYGICAN